MVLCPDYSIVFDGINDIAFPQTALFDVTPHVNTSSVSLAINCRVRERVLNG
jgi:hypothetical protein